MGVLSNQTHQPASPVTAWFCKVGHHLGTTKQKISKPLCGFDSTGGIEGGQQQANFPGFCGGRKPGNRKVYTTLPCLPLLKTAKEEIRLISMKCATPHTHDLLLFQIVCMPPPNKIIRRMTQKIVIARCVKMGIKKPIIHHSLSLIHI